MKGYIFIFFVFIYASLMAQEGNGVITDNYMPVNQMKINPSSMVDQIPWVSINAIGAHAYIRNNFLYAEDYRIQFKEEPELTFDSPSKFGKAFIVTEVLGPSATVAIKHQAFGLHTAFRSYVSANRMPAALAELVTDESVSSIEDGTYEMRNARLKTMSWGELGLSYGRVLYKRNNVMIDGGVTVKRLFGVQQSSLTVRNAEVDVVNEAGSLRNLDGRYSFAEASFGAGRGWGMSIGGFYKKMKDYTDHYVPQSRSHGCKWMGYKYKIGASLIDLGYINFNTGARSASLPDTTSVEALEDYDDNVLPKEEDQFIASLPTALSVQIDYNLQENVYVNAVVVQRMSLRNSFGVERSNLLSITPRYESSLFSIALPLSLANYEVPQVGLYLRIGPLAVGSDHLTPFIIKHDVKAASFYFFLNFPLDNPACKQHVAKQPGKWFCPVWQ